MNWNHLQGYLYEVDINLRNLFQNPKSEPFSLRIQPLSSKKKRKIRPLEE
jgi:hypothetical protein